VFFRTTLPPSASFWIPHGMGRLSKRANTNERIDAQLNLEFDQMWATFGIVRYGTSCLDRLNASNLSTVRAKFWRKKKEFDDTIYPDVVPYGGRTCQPRSGYELLIENLPWPLLNRRPCVRRYSNRGHWQLRHSRMWLSHSFEYLPLVDYCCPLICIWQGRNSLCLGLSTGPNRATWSFWNELK
jgi:hypothetical protein